MRNFELSRKDHLRRFLAGAGIMRGAGTSLAMVGDPSSVLPGDWQFLRERTSRTGVLARTDQGRRARRMGSITAMRHYRQGTRQLSVMVMPFASATDAQMHVHDGLMFLIGIYRTMPKSDERLVDDLFVPNVNLPLGYEMLAHPNGATMGLKVLAGAVGTVFFGVSCADSANAWSWDEVIQVADFQASHIEDCEAAGPHT